MCSTSDEGLLESGCDSHLAASCQVPQLLMALFRHIPDQIAKSRSDMFAQRLSRFQACLKPLVVQGGQDMGLLDLAEVRSLCAEGVPCEVPALRATLWKILLGFLPLDVREWDAVISESRASHTEFVRELRAEVEGWPSGCSLAEEGMKNTLDRISKDVTRTRVELDFFARRLDGVADANQVEAAPPRRLGVCDVVAPEFHFDVLARILLLFAKMNAGVGYNQGMNELCAPLYFLFAQDPLCDNVEADTFHCFNILMGEMQDVFVEDLNESGLGTIGRMQQFDQILKESDFQLWKHFNKESVQPLFYCARWIMSMLTQELEMPDVLRVWDALLGGLEGPRPLLHDMCVARVMLVRDILLRSDGDECIRSLQRAGYPVTSVEDVVSLATRLNRDGPWARRRRQAIGGFRQVIGNIIRHP